MTHATNYEQAPWKVPSVFNNFSTEWFEIEKRTVTLLNPMSPWLTCTELFDGHGTPNQYEAWETLADLRNLNTDPGTEYRIAKYTARKEFIRE